MSEALSRASERRLILLSAGTAGRRQATRELALKLAAEVSWTALADTLRARRLLSTLGPRILELAAGATSRGFASAVEQSLAAGRRHGAFLALVSQHAMSALADAGIPSAPLKGPLLSEAIFGDAGRRLSNDIDLLVAAEQLQPAAHLLRGLGYRTDPHQHLDSRGLPLLHLALLHEQEELPPVELHWRIHWYEGRFARDRLLGAGRDPWQSSRPNPVDELTALLLFYARDGFAGLRQASDLGAWWDVHHGAVSAGAISELLAVYPALSRVIPAAARAAERIVGLPAEEILGPQTLAVRGRFAARLANPEPQASESQLYAQMGLIDGLLAPRGGLAAFARRQLLPPREVLEQHARDGGRKRRRTRLTRGVGMLARYALALRAVARTGRSSP